MLTKLITPFAKVLSSLSRPDYGLLLAFIIPIFAIMPLLTHAGLPNTADGPAHLMRQVELNRAWQEGNFYPRWGTDLALGHGMPIFSYAPPALYQLTQIFHLFGRPLDEAMKSVLIFDFLLYSGGMFLLARRLFGPYPALFAATLYVYAPYRLREAFIQGNYGQFTGLAFYPWILWAFHGLVTTGQNSYLLAAALSLAGLLLSHNISFMLFAPLLAVYLIFLLMTARQTPDSHASNQVDLLLPTLLRLLLAGLLGLGLAAIFWLPAFGERHQIQLEGITQGFFDFRANFIALTELLSPPRLLDLTAINPEFPLSLGLAQLIGAGLGLIAIGFILLRGKRRSEQTVWPALFFAGFLGLYAFLAIPQSQSVWEAIPLLELAEFPWRMLGPAIFCASLLGGFSLTVITRFKPASSRSVIPDRDTSWRNSVSLCNWVSKLSLDTSQSANFYSPILIFITIALNAYYLYPSQFIVWGTPTPADAFRYEATSGAIGTTSTGEFLPAAAQQHPTSATLGPDYAAGRPPQKLDPTTLPALATLETLYHRSEADAFRISSPQPFTATVRTLYWPGWQLYLNDQPHHFTLTEKTGLIQTMIPAGQHTLTLRLESTPLRTMGLWLTLLSAGGMLIILGLIARQYLSQVITPTLQPGETVTARFFLLTGLVLLTGFILSRPLAPYFTLRSQPDRPQPADQLLQVDFGPTETSPALLRLVGRDEFPETIALDNSQPTEQEFIIYWRALQELETNYAVFLHLDGPDGQTYATVDEAHPDNIPTRNWPPGLYLRNSLRLLIPANLPPIGYEVTVGLYDRANNQRLLNLTDRSSSFKLGSLWLLGPQPALPATFLARFGPHVTLWQATLTGNSLELFWQTTAPLEQDYTIFVHGLDEQGNLIGQADGLPYQGLYPFSHWRPQQLITDARPLPFDVSRLRALAIGIYQPTDGVRLPATDANGVALPDNRFIMKVAP